MVLLRRGTEVDVVCLVGEAKSNRGTVVGVVDQVGPVGRRGIIEAVA